MRLFKVGLLGVAGFLAIILLTLRMTGLEPRYIDPRTPTFAQRRASA